MKKILILILLLTGVSAVNAQECDYTKNEVDEFTGDIKKNLKFKEVAKNDLGRLHISLRYLEGTYMLVGHEGDLGCVSHDSKIMIKLEDGEILTLDNFGDIDCGDHPTFYFDISPANLIKLNKSPINKIRLYGSDAYSDLNPTDKEFFIKNLPCVK